MGALRFVTDNIDITKEKYPMDFGWSNSTHLVELNFFGTCSFNEFDGNENQEWNTNQ